MRISIAAGLAAVFMYASVARGAERVAAIEPDASFQSALTAMAAASDRAQFDRIVEKLIASGDRDRLVGQVVWFAAAGAKSPEARSVAGRVMARIDRPKEPVVRALAPLLEDPNAAVQAVAREMLRGYEDQSVTRGPDFSVYRAIIEEDVRAKREPQASLVRLMYESDAGAALLAMVRAYGLRQPAEIKPILWGEHVVSELMWRRRFGFAGPRDVDVATVRELEALSRSQWWWARLYVAEIIRSHPELGSEGVVKQLSGDANGLVRDAIRGSPGSSQSK